MWNKAWLLLPVLFLTACGSFRGPPAPVESRGGNLPVPERSVAVPEKGGSAQVRAYRLPEQTASARPQPARAVQVLMRRAEDQRRAGDFPAAAASLERGLRIEPRNAHLWNKLAHVRSAQKQFARVEQFAAKSNALGGSDSALRADNWQLIAGARAAQGDARGAARARRQATLDQ